MICMTCLWAVNGARTRDPQLGKLVLYQLSYYRDIQSLLKEVEPIPGLEPGTHALRMRCSTNWAISACSHIFLNAVAKVVKIFQSAKCFVGLFADKNKNAGFFIVCFDFSDSWSDTANNQ